jgi:hypothetical protein
MTQFYQLTLEDATALYQSGDLTAKGALKMWVRIRLKEKWHCSLNPKAVQRLFKMSRSTFWRVLHQLAEEGEIEFDEPNSISVKRLPQKDDDVPCVEQPSQKQDSRPKNGTTVPKMGRPSQEQDNRSPKRPRVKERKDSTDLSQIYSNFLQTLSENERETFLKFARAKALSLPEPPQLVEKWIATNLEWVQEEFNKAYPKKTQLIQKDNCSAAKPPTKEIQSSDSEKIPDEEPTVSPMGWTLGDLKRLYPQNWQDAANHYGFPIEEEISQPSPSTDDCSQDLPHEDTSSSQTIRPVEAEKDPEP